MGIDEIYMDERVNADTEFIIHRNGFNDCYDHFNSLPLVLFYTNVNAKEYKVHDANLVEVWY